jgi:hypothetical protein
MCATPVPEAIRGRTPPTGITTRISTAPMRTASPKGVRAVALAIPAGRPTEEAMSRDGRGASPMLAEVNRRRHKADGSRPAGSPRASDLMQVLHTLSPGAVRPPRVRHGWSQDLRCPGTLPEAGGRCILQRKSTKLSLGAPPRPPRRGLAPGWVGRSAHDASRECRPSGSAQPSWRTRSGQGRFPKSNHCLRQRPPRTQGGGTTRRSPVPEDRPQDPNASNTATVSAEGVADSVEDSTRRHR